MFLYITISLGAFSSCNRFLVKNVILRYVLINIFSVLKVDSKIAVGVCGVGIVLLSVLASIGFLCLIEVRSTLIIIEVIPFLVLAVGVDNIFILVQHFNRVKLTSEELSTLTYDEGLQRRMFKLMAHVSPSIVLAAVAESSCFFLGALTPMPAVRVFALNAGIALLVAFVLQMLIFVPMMATDIKRHEQNRFDIFCCYKAKKNSLESDDLQSDKNGFLYLFFYKIYAPFLMKNIVRFIVVS